MSVLRHSTCSRSKANGDRKPMMGSQETHPKIPHVPITIHFRTTIVQRRTVLTRMSSCVKTLCYLTSLQVLAPKPYKPETLVPEAPIHQPRADEAPRSRMSSCFAHSTFAHPPADMFVGKDDAVFIPHHARKHWRRRACESAKGAHLYCTELHRIFAAGAAPLSWTCGLGSFSATRCQA